MYIIPSIDILNKEVVRLKGGNYEDKTVYNISIEEFLNQYSSHGTEYIHVTDRSYAKGDTSNQKLILDAVKKTDIKIQYRGGVKSVKEVKDLLNSGFSRVVVGNQALVNTSFLKDLSNECYHFIDQIVIAIDVLNDIVYHTAIGENTGVNLLEYVDQCVELGFVRFLVTSIDKDGKLEGTDIELFKKVKKHKPFIRLIAAGGISSMQDVEQLRQAAPCEAVVIGKALFEHKISLKEVQSWNLNTLAKF